MHWEQNLIIVKFSKIKPVSELSWNIHNSSGTCGDGLVEGDHPWVCIGKLDVFSLIIFSYQHQTCREKWGEDDSCDSILLLKCPFFNISESFTLCLSFPDMLGATKANWWKFCFILPQINQVMKFPHALVNCCISSPSSKVAGWHVLHPCYVVLYGEGNPIFENGLQYLNLFKDHFVFEQIIFLSTLFYSIIIYFLITWEILRGNSWVHLLTSSTHENKQVFWTL